MIGSIIGGLIGKGGADAAASGIGSATRQAQAAAQHQETVNRSDFSPYTSLGLNATQLIGQLMGFGNLTNPGGEGATYQFDYQNPEQVQKNALAKFQTSPGYQFRLDEGTKALDRSAAARGMLLSGAQTRAVQDYGQNAASAEYGNWINSLYNAAGMGQAATNALAGQNSNLTLGAGNMGIQGANAAGQATMAGSNALASGIGSGINNSLMAAWMGFNPTSGIFRGAAKNATQSGYGTGGGTGSTY